MRPSSKSLSLPPRPPPHWFVWNFGESTKFLAHPLLANQITSVLYLSFHSKDVFFFYATLLLPQHFSPPSLRSCWSKGLRTACWSTLSPTLFGECAKHSIFCWKHGGNCCYCSLFCCININAKLFHIASYTAYCSFPCISFRPLSSCRSSCNTWSENTDIVRISWDLAI